ncbi:MAG: cytidylate kinase-like family protein [Lachnospiraceae bacterium]|nr:cytidylate kinase-like family protein [Agathobacter sp.]MBQ3513113.1 cytidylate kinase-like family protein [Lachnospiraceae bacterium]
MGRKIITISRQTGSGGHEIAELLAEKLNIPLHDRNVVEEARKELELENVDEVDEKLVVDHLAKFAKGYHAIFGKGKLYHMMDHSKDDEPTISEKLYETEAKIIKNLAGMGPCIFVGRCADYVLKDRDDVLSVFITAEEEQRVQRMMDRREMTHERAVNAIEFADRDRAKYYQAYTKQKWGVPETYDITLSSTALGLDGVVEILAKLYEG